MTPFDGAEYLTRVLKPLAADLSRADPETGDVFFVADLDPGADDVARIEERLGDVKAYCQKKLAHPKYRTAAAAVIEHWEAYRSLLCDPTTRRAARVRVVAARMEADKGRFVELDRVAHELTHEFGGIPADRVPALRIWAGEEGVSEEAFAGWLTRWNRLPGSEAAQAQPWERAIRRQIRRRLAELGTADGTNYPTLWSYLGLPADAGVETIRARHRQLRAMEDRARHDSVTTARAELLSEIRNRLLVDGGQASYRATVRADAGDEIAPKVKQAGLVRGVMRAAEYDALVARVVGLGWDIDQTTARAVVREAARDNGVALEVPAVVTAHVLCGACRFPQPDPGPDGACRYCREPLSAPCPACDRAIGTAYSVCHHCGASVAHHRAALDLARSARETLLDGRPLAASRLLESGPRLAGGNEPGELVRVRSDVGDALDHAREQWTSLKRQVATRRLWAAREHAERLARTARDVPDPDDGTRLPEPVRDELAIRRDQLQQRVRALVRRPPQEAEAGLVGVLAEARDCREASAALNAIPLAAPSDVAASPTEEGVLVTWTAAAAPAGVRYRVVREVHRPGAGSDVRTVGQTSGTRLEDATAPAGERVSYRVAATMDQRLSAETTSPAVALHRDVAALRAEVLRDAGPPDRADGQRVVLRWPDLGDGAAVRIVRSAAAGPDGGTGPVRELRPTARGECVDEGCDLGVLYRYHVSAEYRDEHGEALRTPGREVAVTLHPRPVAVVDATVENAPGGGVRVSFAAPPAGRVVVYASSAAAPWNPPAAEDDLSAIEASASAAGARLVGASSRRVTDTGGQGTVVVYTPVTVVADRAIPGLSVEHCAVAGVTDLVQVDSDRPGTWKITFVFPAGITRAMVRWRSDADPAGPEDPGSHGSKVTNTKLEIDGGFYLPAPGTGGSLHVAVYPMVHRSPSSPPVAMAPGTHLEVRPSS